VGKTTVTAALAEMAAEAGLSVLLVDLEGKPGLATAFGAPSALDYTEVDLPTRGSGSIRARRLTPDDALLEYLSEHGMKRVSKRLVSSGAIDVVATAIPGIRDILVLGKVKQLEQSRAAELIVVDAPATGHAMTFLSSASGLLDAARSGPVRTQAADVVELLTDPARCQVALVTLPEEMPINEALEAATFLKEQVGIALGPLIVNGCIEDIAGLHSDPQKAAAALGLTLTTPQADSLAAAALFRTQRRALQSEQRARLSAALDLPQLTAPLIASGHIGPDELSRLAGALAAGVAALSEPAGAQARDAAS
jgi:anion-transporting  ArsA/GET3 family ATPase